MTAICNKCYRPKHATAMMGGVSMISCVEVDPVAYPMGIGLSGIQWDCGCCKCDEVSAAIIAVRERLAQNPLMLQKGARYSACKHFPEMRKDFDCPLCKAELEAARTSALVCVSIVDEVVTFDTEFNC